jgi:hypothetical protein
VGIVGDGKGQITNLQKTNGFGTKIVKGDNFRIVNTLT